MRLTLHLLGVEVLDIAVNEPIPVDAQDIEPEFKAYQDAGYTGSTPVGFAPTPMPPWDDPGSFHSLDADDDLED